MEQQNDITDTQEGLLLEHKLGRQKEHEDLQNNKSFDTFTVYTPLPSKGLDYKTSHNLACYGLTWKGCSKNARSSERTNVRKEDWKH